MRINLRNHWICWASYVLLVGLLMSLLSCNNGKRTRAITFWDGFDFDKIDLPKNKAGIDRLLVDFIVLLDHTEPLEVSTAIGKALDQAKKNPLAFQFFVERLDYRLYNPTSALRNDFYYKDVLNYLIAADEVSEKDKVKYSARLALVEKNLPGLQANNFSFQERTGKKIDLHSLKGNYKLVLFYDPLCNVGNAILPNLKLIDKLIQRTKRSKVTLLAVCAIGEENDWVNYQSELPENWINGYDRENIIRKGLYDLKAFPTIYLIDENNKVLLKDADMEQLVSYIGGMS